MIDYAAAFGALPARIWPVLAAALEAVDPAQAVRAQVRRAGSTLLVGREPLDLDVIRRVIVLGAGKAGAPMAQAIEEILGDRIDAGCVVVKHGHSGPTNRVAIREAGHPVPDAAGLRAGAEIRALAEGAQADDLVLCLLSGGGSALLEDLATPISLDDLQQATGLLLASGAAIHEINAVRKHLSLVKGGQLARAAAPARLVTLILSDVVGSPLDVIASGPTVPDPTSWQTAWAVIERYSLTEALPAPVAARLRAGLQGVLPDTPKPGDPAFARSTTLIVGDNAVAAEAAVVRAGELGWNPLLLTTFLEGEAREAARFALAIAREVQAHGGPVAPPACLIFGGETTVMLGSSPGRGGRNQEIALSAALALEGAQGIVLVSLATDGTDGPTDAAGGWADGETLARARQAGHDAHAALRRHDAYPWLQGAGALLRTGPTRTNVNDLLFVFVDAPPANP